MLSVKLQPISRLLHRRSKIVVSIIVFLAIAVPFFAPHVAHAEAPFDNWNGASAKWINRMTIEFNGVDFVDTDPSDKVYDFTFTAASNSACKSTIAYNHNNGFGGDSPSPYGDGGIASQAGLRLFVPVANSNNCTEVTQQTSDGFGTPQTACKDTWEYHGQDNWTGCRINVGDIGARLISFFVDTDGNVKSINPSQAITFVTAPNTWNGQTVYIRSDQLQGQCKNIITQAAGGQWILFSLRADENGSTNWSQYYDIVKNATGAGALQQDRCSQNPDAFSNVYLAGLDGTAPTGGGYFNIYVGTTANQGGSKAAASGSTTPGSGQGVGGNASDNIAPTCESSGFSLNWILCPIYNATTSFVDWMMKMIITMLHTDNFIDSNGPIYAIWSQFRIYANIILVIAVLIAVFGQSIGEGVFQAFMARTFLMRVFYVVFLVNLSIYLLAGFFDIVNVIGAGIAAAFTAPLHGAGTFTFTPSTAQQTGVGVALGTAGIAAAASGVIWGGLIGPEAAVMVALFIIAPLVIAVITLLFTLGVLRVLKLVAIPTAPVAAALYAIPWGEKYAKKFAELVGGIGVACIGLPALFGVSNLASYLTITGPKNPDHNLFTASFTNIGDMLLAYILIPLPLFFAATLVAGSLKILQTSANMIQNIGKRAHRGVMGNENDPNSTQNKARRRFGAAMTRQQADVIARGENAKKGWRGSVARARGRFTGSGLFGDVTQRQSTYNAIAAKERAAKIDTGGDSEFYAAAGYKIAAGEAAPMADGTPDDPTISGEDRYYNSKGEQISQILYNRGKRLHGQNSHEVGEALQQTLAKASDEKSKKAYRVAFAKNALDGGWSDTEMMNTHAHAAYPHKRTHASVFFSTPEYEKDSKGKVTGVKFNDVGEYQHDSKTGEYNHKSYDSMIKDLHQSRGSFELGGDRHEDFQVMRAWQAELENKVLTKTANEKDLEALGRTYETFDAVSSRLQMTADSEGNVSTSGPTAAAQQAIMDAVAERRLDMTKSDKNGTRQFFQIDQAKAATRGAYRAGSRPSAAALPPNVPVLGEVNTAGGTPTSAPRDNMPSVVR